MKIAEIECATTFNSTGQLEETCRQTLGETSIALTQIGEGLQIVAHTVFEQVEVNLSTSTNKRNSYETPVFALLDSTLLADSCLFFCYIPTDEDRFTAFGESLKFL